MVSVSAPSPHTNLRRNPTFLHLSSSLVLSFPSCRIPSHQQRFYALSTKPGGGRIGSGSSNLDDYSSDLLRKPVVSPVWVDADGNDSAKESDDDGDSKIRDDGDSKIREEEGWVDWEDEILEDTVPLAGFVRMIIHSDKYENGDRLSPEHEKTILEKLLPYHPEYENKIGSGVDYITLGHHPDFDSSRCLFIARKDGELVDFSYWKCLKGLIRKKYPMYADSFIQRHFPGRHL